MKYTSKKGTVINIPDGLNEKQIAKIKARADEGYGTDAQRIATQLGKKAGKGDTTTGGDSAAGDSTTTTQTTGVSQETRDAIDAFLRRGIEGLGLPDFSGAPKVLGTDDFKAERQSVYDSQLALGTRRFEEDKARELEARKQELAERGIPLNFEGDPNNPNNLYGRAIGDINRSWDRKYEDARNIANTAAGQEVTNLVNANATANQQFINQALGGYNAKLDAINSGSGILQQIMSQYNVDQATAQASLDRQQQYKIAKMDDATRRAAINKPTGGGSSGGSGSDRVSGFQLPT